MKFIINILVFILLTFDLMQADNQIIEETKGMIKFRKNKDFLKIIFKFKV